MKTYLDALNYILENGQEIPDRTGTGTLSVVGYQMRFDLSKGFPAVTTKRLAWKNVISELLWFLEGSNDERRLAEIHYGLPRDQIKDKTTIWTANEKAFNKTEPNEYDIETRKLGPIYGVQWRNWGWVSSSDLDQIKKLVKGIKDDPYGRRHILSAWNVEDLDRMALPPCHVLSQFFVRDGKLSCVLYQRSGDAFLGVPFNIASYALLTHMIAHATNLEVGEFIHNFGDLHIYKNHIPQVKEQLGRKVMELPTLKINGVISDDLRNLTIDQFELVGYNSHPAIKAEMAV